ncbi:hypothetical protein [Actinoplanes xinjiangensis]|uniref:hypothetical protein n=1 Tax=Actinoplanes xinjiangensis TaxID=512350 RepID=UPI003425D1DE
MTATATATATATDSRDRSPSIEVAVGAGDWRDHTGPVTVSDEGATTINRLSCG